MKKVLLLSLLVLIGLQTKAQVSLCDSVNISSINDFFLKMKNQDVYICQNEHFFNLNDSIIEINKAPFTILFKTQKSPNKINYGLRISLFKEYIKKNEFKLGSTITHYCYNQSSRRYAQSPYSNYLSISDNNWCYKKDEEFCKPFCHMNVGHQLFYYTDEDYRSMILRDSNYGILNLEYTVDTFFDSFEIHISKILLEKIYIVALQDFNFNNIIDEGELTICILKLGSN